MKKITLIIFIVFASITSFSQSFGNAIRLNGQNDFFEIPNDFVLGESNFLTFESWIKPCDTLGDQAIFSRSNCSNTYGYSLSLIGGQLVWIWSTAQNCSSKGRFRSAVSVQPNVWQHIAIVHSTSTGLQFYLNGQPIPGIADLGSAASSIWVAQTPILVGVATDGQSPLAGYFDGFIDEVRIWKTGLTDAEILSRYNSSLNGNEMDLVAYYNMDANSVNGAGQTISNNATVSGNIIDAQTHGSNASPIFDMHSNSSCSAAPNGVVNYFLETAIHPNTTSNEVLITFNGIKQEVSATLYNTNGQILTSKNYGSVNTIRLEMKYPKGLYFLKLSTASGDAKMIKLIRE